MMRNSRSLRAMPAALALSFAGTPVLAHVGSGGHDGLVHPFTGLDHLLAMLAVGLWAGLVFRRRWWIWPATFAGFILAGFGFARSGGSFPAAETVILASVVALGLAVMFRLKLPALLGAAIVAVFGAAHGFAHGLELAADAPASLFAAGLVLATVILQLCGLGVSALVWGLKAPLLARLSGLGLATAGIILAAMS